MPNLDAYKTNVEVIATSNHDNDPTKTKKEMLWISLLATKVGVETHNKIDWAASEHKQDTHQLELQINH